MAAFAMALISKRLPENVPGDFFVDSTCIDCDACRQIAPASFHDIGEQSAVYRQPETGDQVRKALMALIACPTASIGSTRKHDVKQAIRCFPDLIDENVYFCGFTSESSFGAWSYLVVRPPEQGGNILVDSPRYNAHLTNRIVTLGGLSRMFLTHKDDVADHAKFARKFVCTRIMHSLDGAAQLCVEEVIVGLDPVRLDEDLLAIPTPGHTRGHMALLYKDKFLFTGDHLSWSPDRHQLRASRSTCWYSWPEQTRSMRRLLNYDFEWVLPGHGRIHHAAYLSAGLRSSHGRHLSRRQILCCGLEQPRNREGV
jgi:glyoxylase-like metal-dependent hydrolase (beta-lactamase superfamily II)/ferredoxin